MSSRERLKSKKKRSDDAETTVPVEVNGEALAK
jgi:hypothetical protein